MRSRESACRVLGGIKDQYDCITQFSEVDYIEDLKKMDVDRAALAAAVVRNEGPAPAVGRLIGTKWVAARTV